MMETIYDIDNQTEDNIFAEMNLPKNIRQIGVSEGNRRIYIEDYVMTYLRQLANPNSFYARGAILVGECKRSEFGEVIFISGAVPAQNLELDLQESTFGGDTWSNIYRDVKEFFPELEVVGWFLSRMGFSAELNNMIVQLHMENFPGEDKVLYIMDSLSDEEAFYVTDVDGLRRQTGYYIYYARNEAMQNFMIASKQETQSEQNDVEEKDELLIRNYKKVMEERGRSARADRINKRLSMACTGLAVAVLALGIAVFSNYQMLEMLKGELINRGVIAMDASGKKSDISMGNDEAGKLLKNSSEGKLEEETNKVHTFSEKKKEKLAEPSYPKYYVVQNGDTLSSISFKMYNSVGYVAELMEANEFEEADEIHEGDTIVIPTVK